MQIDTPLANADRDYISTHVKCHIDSLVASNTPLILLEICGKCPWNYINITGEVVGSNPTRAHHFKLWPGSSEVERENVSQLLVAVYFQHPSPGECRTRLHGKKR